MYLHYVYMTFDDKVNGVFGGLASSGLLLLTSRTSFAVSLPFCPLQSCPCECHVHACMFDSIHTM